MSEFTGTKTQSNLPVNPGRARDYNHAHENTSSRENSLIRRTLKTKPANGVVVGNIGVASKKFAQRRSIVTVNDKSVIEFIAKRIQPGGNQALLRSRWDRSTRWVNY